MMLKPLPLHLAAFALAAALSLSVARPAKADVPPPNTGGCSTASAGASCKADDGSPGACVASKCSRLNYNCDAGADAAPRGGPCGTIDYDCLVCKAGSSPSSDAGSAGGGSSSSCSASVGVPARLAPAGLASLAGLAALVLARRRARRRAR